MTAGAVPNSGLDAPPAVEAWDVDSAGLSLPRSENRPPPLGAGDDPNAGVDCGCDVDPKGLLEDCGCGAPPRPGAEVDGVVDDEVVFKPPKRPPGFCAVCAKSD